jgi:hypothetical protein
LDRHGSKSSATRIFAFGNRVILTFFLKFRTKSITVAPNSLVRDSPIFLPRNH